MRRGAITCLSIFGLLLALCLSTGTSTISPARAGELPAKSLSPALADDGAPAPAAGGGDGTGGPGGTGTALDSGDDDDYWDGVNDNDPAPQPPKGLPLLLQILDSWWQSEAWVLP
jgi:hypothetical protein